MASKEHDRVGLLTMVSIYDKDSRYSDSTIAC